MSASAGWPSSRPHAGGDVVAHWVLHSATDLTGARRSLASLVRDLGPDPDAEEVDGRGPAARAPGVRDGGRSMGSREVLVLLLSELVTNALRHARPPAEVTVSRDGTTYLLDVADHDPSTPPVPDHDRSPGLGGHGLPLVAMLATDRGWHVEDGRKHVWAALRT